VQFIKTIETSDVPHQKKRITVLASCSRYPPLVKNKNGDLLSEHNGFLHEVFGNEWEIVR
jgi:hypothetical protein